MTIRAYITQTLIVGGTIGLVWTPVHALINHEWHWWDPFWCMGGFITAIVLIDFIKGQKVFYRG